MLQFPGLVEQSGFFGRDQAAYFLEGLFNKVKPTGFEVENARGGSASGHVDIVGTWSIQGGTRGRQHHAPEEGRALGAGVVKSGSKK